MQNKVFCLMGPTASGKTTLACQLVTHFPFEIISVDSAMIYRGMDIGTAKPTKNELALAPHHLLDIINPPQSYSAAQFCHAASQLCDAIVKRRKIPLLVGGTMMYFHALQQGLSTLPGADNTVRTLLTNQANQLGWSAMHEKLRQVDLISAAKIHRNDAQRIQRALEVFHLTGQPLSALLDKQQKNSSYQFINLILMPTHRSWLHNRIAARFKQMVQQNFLDEVSHLMSTWHLPLTCPAMRTVGYKQAYEYLAGIIDYDMFIDKAQAATRQLAKRQLTWLRHWLGAIYFDCEQEEINPNLMVKITEILDNGC